MKFGIKLWSSNTELIDGAAALVRSDVFQFVEVTPVPGTSIAPFSQHDIPYIIHATNESHNVNIADPAKAEYNRTCLMDCVKWADRLHANYLIVHPGFGRIGDALGFLEDLSDGRILIENMPRIGINWEPMIGYDPAQVQRLMSGRFGLCLDVNHAIKASVGMHMDFRDLVDRFLALRPAIAHISDGHLASERDEHLHIGSGDYDFSFIADRLRKGGIEYVTLETPRENGLDDAAADLARLWSAEDH